MGRGAARCPSCSQTAHDEREGMEPDDLLCSRNARPQKALVGRAQWKINQTPSLKRYRASLEGSSVTSFDERSRTNTGVIPGKVKRKSLEGPFVFMVARCASVRIDWDNPEK